MAVRRSNEHSFSRIPIIDISALVRQTDERRRVADQLGRACHDSGFFYITGHGVDQALQSRLEEVSRRFFAQGLEKKLDISMARGGRAWRGYFPVGGEMT